MRSKTSEFFQTKIRYEKIQDDGLEKIVTETYTVDALSHTEAEEKITEEMSAYIRGEFEVKGIVPAPYKEIFFSDDADDDRWYKAKLQFITIDERTDKEKRSNVIYLVQAATLEKAVKSIHEVMDSTLIDYVIVSVAETPILDVFEHKSKSSNDDTLAELDGKSKAAGE